MKVFHFFAPCVIALGTASAQELPDTAQVAQDSALRVFIDCPDTDCDFDYFRTEITFVNHVRDRQYAQVHVLITGQRTGGGGTEFTITFIGLKELAGTADTLRHVASNIATDDEIRQALARTIRLGLVRFAAKTPVADRLQVSYSAPPGAAAQVRDPWNYWVFRTALNGFFNGETMFKTTSLFGRLSADRITEAWKISLSATGSYNQNDFEVTVFDTAGMSSGTETITSITRSYGGNGLAARSLGRRWSAGAGASVRSSTFLNQDLTLRFAPAIEFDVYPYSESTRRLLTLRYEVGVASYNYRDTTIFDETAETLFDQRLTVSLDLKQPWGSTGLSLEASHFLHDINKNRLVLFGNGDVRLFKGLSLNVFGQLALIHDQVFLEKGAASEEEVLLRQRQLATSYRYFASVGLSYTFGSKFSNIVNPRFDDFF